MHSLLNPPHSFARFFWRLFLCIVFAFLVQYGAAQPRLSTELLQLTNAYDSAISFTARLFFFTAASIQGVKYPDVKV